MTLASILRVAQVWGVAVALATASALVAYLVLRPHANVLIVAQAA